MKRLCLSICLLVLAAFSVAVLVWFSQHLTAEAATVLIRDDFEDGNADGWTVQAGEWSVIAENHVYTVSWPGSSPDSRRSFYTGAISPTLTDYAVQARVMVQSGTAPDGWAMIMARWRDSANYYYLALERDGDVQVGKYVGGSSTTMGTANLGLAVDTWYLATLEVSGTASPMLRAVIDGTPVLTVTDDSNVGGVPPFVAGTCAVGSYRGDAQFDEILVRDVPTAAVLLSEDFEDGVADDWTEQDADSWSVVFYNYVYNQSSAGTTARTFTGSPTWTDYSIQARVRLTYVGSGATYAMLMARYQDKDNYYFMAVRANQRIEIKRMLGGSSGTALASIPYSVTTGTWYTAKLEVRGYTLRAFMEGTPVLTVTDDLGAFAAGHPALGSSRVMAQFDDVVVSDLNVYTLTVSTAGTGSGSVSSDPAGIDCGLTCTAGFESGTVVTLTATPTGTSSFAGWLGACIGTGECIVTMDAVKSVTAVFSSLENPMLIVNRAGNGDGSVTSEPSGIDCGLTCMASFPQNTRVTLTATPVIGSAFSGWSGAGCGGTDPCVLTMDMAKNVTAAFELAEVSLSLHMDGSGRGSVTSDPVGIDCGVTCTAIFPYGIDVTLTATPETGSALTAWSGACSGTGDCVVAMDAHKQVTATFDLIPYTLTVSRAGNGMGSVLSNPPGINNCSAVTCTASFGYGTEVTLTATPNTSSSFAGWSGEGCSGTGFCFVTMDADRTVVATFVTYRVYLPIVMRSGEPIPTIPDFSMVGYATLAGGTTGGAGGTVVTVTTLPELQMYAESAEPYIIQIGGTISATARVNVQSNKTIVGIGSSGELIGVELNIRGVNNIIIRNLKISKVKVEDADAIHLQGPDTHHIWIDHCDLSSEIGNPNYDGLVDITHAVDYVTLSWNVFHDHDKTSLIGHSDGNVDEDTGHFLITFHHNYFYHTGSRQPSNRFGTVHVYNNYYADAVSARLGVSSRMGACTRVEKNYFQNIGLAILTDQSYIVGGTMGNVQLIDNIFVDVGGYATSPTCDLAVPYSYVSTLHDTIQVPSIVKQYAGVGKVADPLDW